MQLSDAGRADDLACSQGFGPDFLVELDPKSGSQYVGGKHYTDRVLQGIDCGGGWICMTYCMEKPF